jgi:hypothetical protein
MEAAFCLMDQNQMGREGWLKSEISEGKMVARVPNPTPL